MNDVLPLQDKRALGFQRHYHVTDPFIKRLGLEAELQVRNCTDRQTDRKWSTLYIFLSLSSPGS